MKDETYAFISDVKEKKVTARSARHMRTHCGKGGRVRLPSDNLSKKELMKMSGECKSYRLNDPMAWKEFMSMPVDLRVTYIKLLRQKFNVPDKNLAEMFGVNKDYVYRTFKQLGLQRDVRTSHPKWDKEGFWAWANGVDKLPTPVPEEIPVVEPIQEEPEAFVEDDLPFDIAPVEPDPNMDELNLEVNFLKSQVDDLRKVNEVLMANHENDLQVIEKLRLVCSEYEENARILEAQMDVVRMIFGGQNRG